LPRRDILGLLFLLEIGVGGCRSGGGGAAVKPEIRDLETAPWGNPSHVIAEVNGKPITRGDFYARVLRQLGTSRILSGVIKEELFFQEAERKGIRVAPEEIEARVDRLMVEMEREMGGQEAMAELYRREGIALADLRRDLEREMYPQLVTMLVTKSMRRIDEAAIRQYYQETYKYTRYVTRHIAYGFQPDRGATEGDANRLKLEAYNRASRAADRIRKGSAFETLARAESEDQVTAQNGGYLGAIHEESPMEPALKKVVFALRPGEVSEPVENPGGGYHIFQVIEIIPGESFADAEPKIKKEVAEREPSMEEIETAVKALRERAQVKLLGEPWTPEGEAKDPGARGRKASVPAPVPTAPAGPAPASSPDPASAPQPGGEP
jgi:parvulin-like peptidyl-prolyl isomerase